MTSTQISLFENETQRELWIKLKTQFNCKFQQIVNKNESCTYDDCLMTTKNQLAYDELNGQLRITLEQLQTYTFENYVNHLRSKHQEWLKNFE